MPSQSWKLNFEDTWRLGEWLSKCTHPVYWSIYQMPPEHHLKIFSHFRICIYPRNQDINGVNNLLAGRRLMFYLQWNIILTNLKPKDNCNGSTSIFKTVPLMQLHEIYFMANKHPHSSHALITVVLSAQIETNSITSRVQNNSWLPTAGGTFSTLAGNFSSKN